jgi:hypothetical protein
MVNMAGESHPYSWAEHAPDKIDQPSRANIEVINTKSAARPFLIVPDSPFELYGQSYASPLFRPFNMEIKREHSIFPWWNHWPVAQIPSDGRWATEPDRIAHSSLTTGLEWKNTETTPVSRTRVMLHGLTERSPAALAALGRSWLRAPALTFTDPPGAVGRYDVTERAYVVDNDRAAAGEVVRFEIAASDTQPLVNPAFILRQWTAAGISLTMDGKPAVRGRDFQSGISRHLAGNDLIVWLKLETNRPVRIELQPAGG